MHQSTGTADNWFYSLEAGAKNTLPITFLSSHLSSLLVSSSTTCPALLSEPECIFRLQRHIIEGNERSLIIITKKKRGKKIIKLRYFLGPSGSNCESLWPQRVFVCDCVSGSEFMQVWKNNKKHENTLTTKTTEGGEFSALQAQRTHESSRGFLTQIYLPSTLPVTAQLVQRQKHRLTLIYIQLKHFR